MDDVGCLIWLTGLSGSGKTTLATALGLRLSEHHIQFEILDGDEVRQSLSSDLGFSRQDRTTHLKRLSYIAHLLTNHGVTVIVAAISPYQDVRDMVRSESPLTFVEIYCKCALEIAEQRDVKGLYKKARAGQIPSFTGISDPYEEPSNPEIIVDTAKETVCESLDNIWVALTERAYINVEQTEHQLVTRA